MLSCLESRLVDFSNLCVTNALEWDQEPLELSGGESYLQRSTTVCRLKNIHIHVIQYSCTVHLLIDKFTIYRPYVLHNSSVFVIYVPMTYFWQEFGYFSFIGVIRLTYKFYPWYTNFFQPGELAMNIFITSCVECRMKTLFFHNDASVFIGLLSWGINNFRIPINLVLLGWDQYLICIHV